MINNMLKNALKNHIRKKFGRRCMKFLPQCATCQAWYAYDILFLTGDGDAWKAHVVKK